MSRMFPPVLYPGCAPGEKFVFEELTRADEADGWAVFHSVWLPEHVTQLEGEADFVVIVPSLGVCCLEVKSARRIRVEHGVWYFGGDDARGDRRGPFRQADEAMHSLRKKLVELDRGLSGVPFMSGVIVPFLELPPGLEVPRSQMIDQSVLRGSDLVEAIRALMRAAREKLAAAGFPSRRGEPSPEQCERLQRLIRPRYELHVSPRAIAEIRDEELRRYTQEQFDVLDMLEPADRLLIHGPAGTGKTMLAIEAARRGAGRDRRVLALCFNRMLGTWLQAQLAPLGQAVLCSHLHSFLERIAPARKGADRSKPEYWERELPAAAADALLEGGEQFDELIIDEAQDLAFDPYLDVLDLLVRGGLSGGRWRFFADFERQAIHGTDPAAGRARLLACPGALQVPLRVNCRNPRRIARAAELLAALSPGYTRVRRESDTGAVVLRWYSKPEEQLQGVRDTVRDLKRAGLDAHEIILLSSRTDSCGRRLQELAPGEFAPAQQRTRHQVGFCTVHAFKGCEAPAVILTDVTSVRTEKDRDLFYIGTTRATDQLFVFSVKSVRDELQKLAGI